MIYYENDIKWLLFIIQLVGTKMAWNERFKANGMEWNGVKATSCTEEGTKKTNLSFYVFVLFALREYCLVGLYICDTYCLRVVFCLGLSPLYYSFKFFVIFCCCSQLLFFLLVLLAVVVVAFFCIFLLFLLIGPSLSAAVLFLC